MASTSSVPRLKFTPAGITLPTEAEILDGVLSDMDAAFGGGLNLALETPQGQLASSQAAIVADKNAELAYIINQLDPQYAADRFQDALGRIYFLTRKPATATTVAATLTGVPGTIVPAGTLAQDTSGNSYANLGDATIGAAGTVIAQFANLELGPIPCAAGTLTQVYQAVAGWDAIDNAAAGTLGSEVEGRADFEYRRKNSVAANGHGSAASIYAAVFAVDGVLDVYVTENSTAAPVNTGATNYPLGAHSVYVAAIGGTDADVANAIWSKKDLGCNMIGNTTATVTDDSGYAYPAPSYAIKFERPAALPIFFSVQIVNDPSLPANIVTLIQDAILARFNGQDGTARERIGATIFASRYYGAVGLAYAGVSLLSVAVGIGAPAADANIVVGIDQAPTLSAANIAVTLV